VQRRVHDARYVLKLGPQNAWDGIEVNAQFVGMIEIVGTNGMGMKFQTRKVCHPRQRGCVPRHDFFSRATRGEGQRDHVDPVGARRGRTFLKEEVLTDAVRIPDEHIWPTTGATQSSVSHGDIVLSEIEFRVPRTREEYFVGIGNRDLASRNDDELAFTRDCVPVPLRAPYWTSRSSPSRCRL
jgi:hypothetical protein